MSNDGNSDSNLRAVTNSHQMWAGGFNDRVVSDPNVLADLDASPPVQEHACSGSPPGQFEQAPEESCFLQPGSSFSDLCDFMAIRLLLLQNANA